MIVEITTYKLAKGVSHGTLLQASKEFDRNYCSHCKGLIRRQFLKTYDGYMDVFLWQSQADADSIKATFTQDRDALLFIKLLDPDSLSMTHHEVLDVYEPETK